jgi:hypothetical protein
MCLLRRQLDPKSRRIFAAGNLCLISSLMLTLFVKDGFRQSYPAIVLGVRFLLVGLAIVLLFWSARRTGECASRS